MANGVDSRNGTRKDSYNLSELNFTVLSFWQMPFSIVYTHIPYLCA